MIGWTVIGYGAALPALTAVAQLPNETTELAFATHDDKVPRWIEIP